MEQRIGNQKDPHFGTQNPLEFLIPASGSLSLPENNGRHLFRYPLRRANSPATDPQSCLYFRNDSDQTLESAFSCLNLSSAYHHQPPFLPAALDGDIGGVNPLIGGGGLSPFSSFREREQRDLSVERLRFQKGHTGFVGHRNPTVGSESWENYLTFSNPTAVVREPSYRDECSTSSYESFLHCKKPLPKHLDTHFPILPSSMGNFDSPIDGSVSSNSNFSRSNLYNHGLSHGPQNLISLCLEDLRGNIVSLAKDQYGCRILQAKFEDPNVEEIEMVLSELIEYVGDLMKNQFGNYLIQKLVVVCNEKQRTWIILSVTKTPFQLIGICLNPHGTRVVQKLLEHLTSPQQVSLVMSALSPGAATLANNPNGQHVIQYCLIHFSNEDNKHILNEIADYCFGIATDRSGCVVLQSCVEHSKGERRERLVAEILANAIHLAEDPYGNYVLQHMLGLRIPEVTANLLRQLEGSYASLSCNKYASNVVEKCLIESEEEQSTRIVMELLKSPNAPMLLLDPFGNFVIQSALLVSKGVVRNALLNLVRMNAPSMRSNLYGKKILALFDKRKPQV